jgi:hypothetical protein
MNEIILQGIINIFIYGVGIKTGYWIYKIKNRDKKVN